MIVGGRFDIETELGRGGVGRVYRALDRSTGQRVALKLLERDAPAFISLFEREYRVLASLQHPRIIGVYEFGIDERGARYYTMELLEGDDLARLAPLPWKVACAHLRDAATSLALLHARRLIHRDVTPRNVRIDREGRAKLIDFGILASFGVANELLGTPSCVAPEVVRGAPLDHRSDLYSLGVVAYHALTGRLPYSMRDLRAKEMEITWQAAPALPSSYAEDIPRALDQLVMSLLSLDVMARPSSVAEVIDRLGAIAGLGDEPLAEIAMSHIQSSALVGRDREQDQIAHHLARMARGHGHSLLIRAEPGMGKSRLMRELVISAELLGAIAVRVDALSYNEPFGVARALGRQLVERAPAEAIESLEPYRSLLGQAFEELGQHAPTRAPRGEPLLDDAEKRARIQEAMVEWCVAVAQRRPLVVVFDDAHAADPPSAGVIIALAHASQQHRLLVATSVLSNADAPQAVQRLANLSARIKLRGLQAPAVDQLIESVCGAAQNRARIAHRLHGITRGNPAHCVELFRHLIERGIVRYAQGTWVLPEELPEHDLPAGFQDAVRARIEALSPSARALAEMLALYRGAASLDLCVLASSERDRRGVLSAIEELSRSGVLSTVDGGYLIGQQILRHELEASLDDGRRKRYHGALGRALSVLRPDLLADDKRRDCAGLSIEDLHATLEAGRHFLRGGEEARGARLVSEAAAEMATRGEGLTEAAPALEEALQVFREQGRSRWARLNLLVALASAGLFVDFRYTYRHADEFLEGITELTGITLAGRLAPYLGKHLALAIGLFHALVLYHLTSRREAGRTFREAFMGLLGGTALTLAVYAVTLDVDRAKRLMRAIEPLDAFPTRHPAHFMFVHLKVLHSTLLLRIADAYADESRLLEELRDPRDTRGFPDKVRLQLFAGMQVITGQMNIHRPEPKLFENIEAITSLGLKVHRQNPALLLSLYHAKRGELLRARKHEEQVDVLAAQAGSIWREDLILMRSSIWACYHAADVVGCSRVVRALEALSSELPTLAPEREVARVAYLICRGSHEEALACLDQAFADYPPASDQRWVRNMSLYARVYNELGQHARAKEICASCLERLPPPDRAYSLLYYEIDLDLARAEAGLGDFAAARKVLDDALATHAKHDNPLIHGEIQAAYARVALRARDQVGFERHTRAMRDWFQRTENPALIAQCEQLEREGRALGLLKDARSQHPLAEASDEVRAARDALRNCRGPVEREQRALELLTEKLGARAGYLYLLQAEGLRFVAPRVGAEPPEEVADELAERVACFMAEDGATARTMTRPEALRSVYTPDDDGDGDGGRELSGQPPYESLILALQRGRRLVVVGAAALVQCERPARLYPELVQVIAEGLWDAGDVKTRYVGPSSSQRALS